MCIVKTPKIANPTPATDKPLPIIRNPLLDGFTPATSLRVGRSSLRTDLPAPDAAAYSSPTTAPSSPLRPTLPSPWNRLNV